MFANDTEFQIFVQNTIRIRFPQNEGYQILKQPTSLTGTNSSDFLVNGLGGTIVVAANNKEQVEMSDIDRLLH
jgi:hypothetical protein